jgi:hypothetical protein
MRTSSSFSWLTMTKSLRHSGRQSAFPFHGDERIFIREISE